jgi:hypothetical protein
MIRKITLLFLAMLFVQLSAFSQRKCGSDIVHQRLMATDPAYAANDAAFRAKWAAFMSTYGNNPQALKTLVGSGPDTVFEIPVVVHVLRAGNTGDHALGERYNPSDAQIQAYIDYTNAAFAASYTGYPTPTTGGTRLPFKLVLAKRDTQCNSATGIVRINAATTFSNYLNEGIDLDNTAGGGVNEIALKNLSRWRTSVYYNIYIVNKIDGEDGYNSTAAYTAGYAYYPGAAANVDGAVILASTVFYRASGPGAWTSGGPGNITLPHEFGHAMNLKHVFDPTPNSSCPPATNCSTTGDEVCDTQPIASSNFSCPTSSTLTCNGVPNDGVTARNMMDYSNCQDRFTNGQMLRMMYALKNQVTRSTFITSLGATSPPSTSLPTACTPTTNANSFNLGVYDVIVTTGNNPSPAADTLMHVVSSGYLGDGSRGYIDHTCTHRVTMTAGTAYKLFVNVGTGTTTSRARVFIDYNNDGTFNTTTEQVMALSAAGAGYKNVTFTVPTTGIVYCAPLRMRVIADGGGSATLPPCGPYAFGQAEDYTAYIIGAGGSSTASVGISNPPIGGNPSCLGTALKFYAIPGTGVTITGYKWLRNNVIQAGQTTDTFASTIFANNDQVKVRMFYTTPCGTDSVESPVVTVIRAVTIAPTVTIGIQNGTIPGCIDDTVTFRVTGNVNPGGAPTYQWQQMIPPAVVFSNVAGETGTTYKVWGKPANTQIRVVMTSSAGSPCAIPSTANSNAFTLTYNQKAPTVSIALTTGTNPGCSGQVLAFTATPVTGGTAPTYQWYVNNVLQVGVTGPTLTGTRANGDQVRCVLTSNSPCASPTTANSNTITIIHTQITADVSIAQVTPSPSCDGKDVTFSATTINSGNNPLYQWYKNDTAVGTPTGPNFTIPLVDNDRIKVVFIATDPCVLNTLDTSNELTVTTKPSNRPTLSVNITSGKDPGCLDSVVEFTASAFNMGINVNYVWFVNGFPAGIGNTYSSNAFLTGDIVTVRANQTDGQCYIPDTLFSEPDTMLRSITLDPPIIHLIGNMIVVDRKGSFVWFGPGGQLTGGTTGTYHPTAIGPYYAVTDNMGCWSRPSNILTITMLDIETVDMKDLGVYPNPTSGLLTLDWKGRNVNVDITVYSQLGQVVLQDEVKDASMKVLNLGKLANGTYQIVVKDTDGKKGVIKVQVNR